MVRSMTVTINESSGCGGFSMVGTIVVICAAIILYWYLRARSFDKWIEESRRRVREDEARMKEEMRRLSEIGLRPGSEDEHDKS